MPSNPKPSRSEITDAINSYLEETGEVEETAEPAPIRDFDLGTKLHDIKMDEAGNAITNSNLLEMPDIGWDISTREKREKIVNYLLWINEALKWYGEELKKRGLMHEAEEIINYSPLINERFPTIENRINAAKAYLETDYIKALSVIDEPLPQQDFEDSLNKALEALKDSTGVLQLRRDIDTIIIPDIHGRRKEFAKILMKKDEKGVSNIEKLERGELQIVCIGDAMHTLHDPERWEDALDETLSGTDSMPKLEDEIKDSLTTEKIIMYLIGRFPDFFHYTKGNHDNVKNSSEGGDHQFLKFEVPLAYVTQKWVERKYSNPYEFLDKWSEFEHKLPLLAIGNNFVTSHAEPCKYLLHDAEDSKENKEVNLTLDDIVNRKPEAVDALTWSRDDKCGGNIADKILAIVGQDPKNSYYFVGHTEYNGKFAQLPNHVVRVNNGFRLEYIFIPAKEQFDPKKHILTAGK